MSHESSSNLKTPWPLISIIVVNYNGIQFIRECLESVLSSDYPNFEVIIIDNGSKDGSLDFVRSVADHDDRVRIYRHVSNLGVTRALNRGIEVSRGEYIVLLNNDTSVDRTWLRELLRYVTHDRSIAGAQCKLISSHDRLKIDSAGCYLDLCGHARERGTGQIDSGQFDCVAEIFSAGCPASILKKSIITEVGCFDDGFFAGYEDADLCWRIRLRGYKLILAPTAVVYHFRSGTSGANTVMSDVMAFHFSKNWFMMLLKNYSMSTMLRITPNLFSSFLLSLLGYLLFAKGRRRFVILKSSIWVIRNIRYIIEQRAKVQCLVRRVDDKVIQRNMSKKCYLISHWLEYVRFLRHNRKLG